MCELCNKSVYFNTSWSCRDAGYGDTDYGGETKNEICAIICPWCGTVKPYGIEKYGSVENALTQVLMLNLSNNLNKEEMLAKLNQLLSAYGKENLDMILKQNNLVYIDGKIEHSCGYVFLRNVKSIENIDVLVNIFEKKDIHYCQRCGEEILPLDTVISNEEKPIYYEVESHKTWDRNE